MDIVAKAWLTLEEAQKWPCFLLKPYEGSPSGASVPQLGRSQGTHIVTDQQQGLLRQAASLQTARRCT